MICSLMMIWYSPEIRKLPEGIELDDERIENVATVFPLQYLSMFEVMRKEK